MKRVKRFQVILIGYSLLVLTLAACNGRFPVTGWPIDETDEVHEIGNSGGEFQQYGGAPYFHGGIDILEEEAPDGPWVRTVREGTPVLTLPGAASLYNGLAVTADDGDQYLYWHLDFNSIQQVVRDAETDGVPLPANSLVSRLVFWTSCDYHHLHYEMSDDTGIMDPIYSVTPRNDTTSPLVLNVYFTENGSTLELPRGALGIPILSGLVDVVAHAHDRQFGTARTGVMELRYWVTESGGTEAKAPTTIRFRNIPADANASIIYMNAVPFDSSSSYCSTENYYYILTNVDESGSIIDDDDGFWDTTTLSNGTYHVHVEVKDQSGNDFELIKQVTIDN